MLCNTELNAYGWVFMIGSIGAVGTLLFCCYKRILTQPEQGDPGP